MARYISLIRFTAQGARDIRKSTQRAKAFVRSAEKKGVEVEGQYWTVGAFDGVLVLRSKEAKNILRCLTDLAGRGDVTTQTMESFDAAAFKAVVGA